MVVPGLRPTARRLLGAAALSLLLGTGGLALAAAPAAALPCRDTCPGGGGDGGGGSGSGGGGGTSLPLQARWSVGLGAFASYTCYQPSPDQRLCAVQDDTLPGDDDISLDVRPDQPAGTLRVVLSDAPDITWWKSVQALDASGRTLGTVSLQDSAHGPVTMTLPASSTTALVFGKAGFLGVHTRTYDVRGLSARSGSTLTFTWTADGCGDGRGGDGHGRSC